MNKTTQLEKIYTPDKLIYLMLEHLLLYYNDEITQFIEPAAGSGNIINVLKKVYPLTPIISFDIYNETNNIEINEVNFLQINKSHTFRLNYKKGRVCIMNPPFSIALRFIYESLKYSDFIVAILPISSIFNLDYTKCEVKKIDIYNNFLFCDNTYQEICIMSIAKLKNDSKITNNQKRQ